MRWTDKRDRTLRELFSQGKSYSQMANVIGTSRSSVAARCWRLGLVRGSNGADRFKNQPNEIAAFTGADAARIFHWREKENRSFPWMAIRICRPAWEIERFYSEKQAEKSDAA